MRRLKDIMDYAEANILPLYRYADAGHRADHIKYVIRRSDIFAETWNAMHPNEQVDICMVYAVAAFHDIGLTVGGRDEHHVVSAGMFLTDSFCERFFTEDERHIIAEAIEDHRASLDGEPRSIYGRIVSQADRDTSASSFLKRMLVYRLADRKRFPTLTAIISDMQGYISEKYGVGGYAVSKIWFDDRELSDFIHTIRQWGADRALLTQMTSSVMAYCYAA